MKNLFDVLRQKETELQQIKRDVAVLQIAARLLADEEDLKDDSSRRPVAVLSRP